MTDPKPETTDLHIRHVPIDIARRFRAIAVSKGLTSAELFLRLLEMAGGRSDMGAKPGITATVYSGPAMIVNRETLGDATDRLIRQLIEDVSECLSPGMVADYESAGGTREEMAIQLIQTRPPFADSISDMQMRWEKVATILKRSFENGGVVEHVTLEDGSEMVRVTFLDGFAYIHPFEYERYKANKEGGAS